MRLMIILEATKKQALTLSVENTLLRKSQGRLDFLGLIKPFFLHDQKVN